MLGLAQRVEDRRILVDPLVELRLKLLLRHANEEVSNKFWNSFAYRPNGDLKDRVDSHTQLVDEDVAAGHLLLLLGLLGDGLAVLVVLGWHLLCFWDDRSALLLVFRVIGEEIVLL